MGKYSEAGKGSINKLKQKKIYDNNYDKIWANKKNKLCEERYYDSDETISWDEDKANLFGINSEGDIYIK